MYLLHAFIVADRLAQLSREADDDRLARSFRDNRNENERPVIARRLIARIALSVSQASARLASWSDPTTHPSTEALGYR